MNEVEAVARAIEDQLTAEDGWEVGTPALRNMCTDFAQAAIAALDAVRGQAEPAAWMPIKTAPKDGTTIDVWRDGHRYTVYWGLPPHCCGEMGQYCDSDWHGLKEPGWICSTFGEFVGGEHHPFTHWMPLPDAPEQSND